jgi:hypothetical protein
MTVRRPSRHQQSEYELAFEIDGSPMLADNPSGDRCDGDRCPDSKLQAEMSSLPGLVPKLRGKHVVMIGDSITRYQYLNLAHFVAYGHAPAHDFYEKGDHWHSNASDTYVDNMHGFWNEWYAGTNRLLNFGTATETCDCWRNRCCHDAFENRYFHDHSQDIHLTFFQWYSNGITLKGHILPNQNGSSSPAGSCEPPAAWEYPSVGYGLKQFLNDVVMQLKPTPTHVVMNRAKWGHLGAIARADLFRTGQNIRRATGATSFIWKTATISNGSSLRECCADADITNDEIVDAKKYGWDIFDAFNSTKSLFTQRDGRFYDDDNLYVDKVHFKENVYAYLNGILLNMI